MVTEEVRPHSGRRAIEAFRAQLRAAMRSALAQRQWNTTLCLHEHPIARRDANFIWSICIQCAFTPLAGDPKTTKTDK